MQTHVFLSSAGTLHAAVNGLPPLAAQAAERARPFGDVVFEQVDPGVALLPQVGRGQVRHAGCLLVVLVHHLVHVGVRVCELLKRLAPCGTQVSSEAAQFQKEPDWCRTASERVSKEDSRQEAAKTTHGQVTDEAAELPPDLLALKPPLRVWSYANI